MYTAILRIAVIGKLIVITYLQYILLLETRVRLQTRICINRSILKIRLT